MEKTILNDTQIRVLNVISKNKDLCEKFYLSGGTALAEFYLQHRLSEDLDFFSEDEFDLSSIVVFLKTNKKIIGYDTMDFQNSFNRNLFFLKFKNEILKMEFTYYPFERIENTIKKNWLYVDSLIDIAVNKLFTIYQQPRSRDFIDLFLILKKQNFKLEDLIKMASIKFDTNIDYLQLGAKFSLSNSVKDFPRMIEKLPKEIWQSYFVDLGVGFKNKFLK